MTRDQLEDLIEAAEEGQRNAESDAADGVMGGQEAYDRYQSALEAARDDLAEGNYTEPEPAVC